MSRDVFRLCHFATVIIAVSCYVGYLTIIRVVYSGDICGMTGYGSCCAGTISYQHDRMLFLKQAAVTADRNLRPAKRLELVQKLDVGNRSCMERASPSSDRVRSKSDAIEFAISDVPHKASCSDRPTCVRSLASLTFSDHLCARCSSKMLAQERG